MSGLALGAGAAAHGPKGHFRPDIQGLRAIAVLLVLVYHVWPSVLPGGFIGVDVFFVISGFLITSLLKRELDVHGRIRFADFYARRVKRLLPAALVVLVAILAGTLLLLPVTVWRATAHEVAAAALYVENWWLVGQAVDYLALDGAASPVQHFWSLSVEEQFYFFWPLLLAAAWCVGRLRGGRATTISVLALVLAASLAYSIVAAMSGEAAGYFSTLTRVWQLAAGGMLAFLPVPRSPVALACLLAGLVAVLLSGVLLTGALPYPGYLALAPTVGAALMLHGGSAYGAIVATRWLGSRPAGFVGDVSYSLYLWHWPLIVFYKAWSGAEPGWLDGLALIAAALVLAALSKRYVEDPFRRAHRGGVPWRAIAGGVLCSLLVVTAALWMAFSVAGDQESAGDVAASPRYPGAMVMLQPEPLVDPVANGFLPKLPHVEGDVASAYQESCIQNINGTQVTTCRYGNPDARVRIAVVGDSHAVHWLPAFELLARDYDVYVEGLTKTSCITSGLPVYHQKLTRPYTQCNAWTRNVIDYLNQGRFDLVVISQSPKHRIAGRETRSPQSQADDIAKGMAQAWSRLRKEIPVSIIRPTPWQPTLVRDCVASHDPPYAACVGEQERVLSRNALSSFARISGHRLLDFTDMFCRDGRCPPIIGNVFVYRDSHHITASYMRTLAPVLAQRLELPLDRRAPGGGDVSTALVRSVPAPEQAADDRDDAYRHGCVQSLRRDTLKVCRYGAKLEETRLRIAVVGDATGANLLPALKEGAVEHGWRVETYLKESCLWSDRPVWNRKLRGAYTGCVGWSGRVARELLRSRPDVVLLAQSPTYTDDRARTIELAAPRLAAGIAPLVADLEEAGIEVVVLRSLPVLPQNAPQCLTLRRDPALCGGRRADSLRTGALDLVAGQASGVTTLDLSDAFCGQDRCEPIIDGLLVYRDGTQPTRTFARTLAPEVRARLQSVLGPEPARSRRRAVDPRSD